MKILLVEDEKRLAEAVKIGLQHEGHIVDTCGDGLQAETIFRLKKRYDLAILDVMLPGMDGFQLCLEIRKQDSSIPILMLTARSEVEDKVTLLNAGADDYLTKPFSFEELVARIRALLRRPAVRVSDYLTIGNVTLDTGQYKVLKNNKEIEMTKKEFVLLEYLMRRPNQVVTREDLYSTLWDVNDVLFSNVVDVHIKNIRNKIESKHEDFIETIRGVGYLFKG